MSNVSVLSDFIDFFQGVPIFFTMSGFLIWWSIGRSKSYNQYLQKRFWRIFPELWVAVLIELVVLLLLYDGAINWLQFGIFAVTQSTMFQFWTPDCLRGYGCGCPNGALWTICVLIQFYIFAFFIYKALHNRKSWIWIVSIVISVAFSYVTILCGHYLPELVEKLYHQTLLPYLWMFLFPSYVAEKKDMILPFLKKYWLVFLAATLIHRFILPDISASYNVIDTMLLFCTVTGFAYAVPQLNIKTDISYGVYIYHMTVVNALIALGYMGHQWEYFVVLVITCVFAYLSTIYVGEFSKKMKNKIALN